MKLLAFQGSMELVEIVSQLHLSIQITKKYLRFLVSNTLIKERGTEPKGPSYSISSKGLRVLAYFEELQEGSFGNDGCRNSNS